MRVYSNMFHFEIPFQNGTFLRYIKNKGIDPFIYIDDVCYYSDGSCGKIALNLDPVRVDPVPITSKQLEHNAVHKLFSVQNGIVVSINYKWDGWAVLYNNQLFLPDGQIIDWTKDIAVRYVDGTFSLTNKQLKHKEVVKYLETL